MIGNLQQGCCCDTEGGTGPETGPPVTECPPFTTPVNQRITVNVTAKPTMWCPVTSVECESFAWCEPHHPGFPNTACFGRGPQSGGGGECQDPPFWIPVIGPNLQVPRVTYSNTYETATIYNGAWGGWNRDGGTPPCWCTDYVPCSTASYVIRPFSPLSASPQFNFSAFTESIPPFQSNPSDLSNSLSIGVKIISFCADCTCSPGLLCSKIAVSIGASWNAIAPDTYLTRIDGGCDVIPYENYIIAYARPEFRPATLLQTAGCIFERVITTSQTNARMAGGSYQLISAGTHNEMGGANIWGFPVQDNPCDPSGIDQSAECGPSVAQILTNAGFTIECTVS